MFNSFYNYSTLSLISLEAFGDNSKFEIIEISETHVKAKIYGESTSHKAGKLGVKAITKYKFDVVKHDKGYTSYVAVDI